MGSFPTREVTFHVPVAKLVNWELDARTSAPDWHLSHIALKAMAPSAGIEPTGGQKLGPRPNLEQISPDYTDTGIIKQTPYTTKRQFIERQW